MFEYERMRKSCVTKTTSAYSDFFAKLFEDKDPKESFFPKAIRDRQTAESGILTGFDEFIFYAWDHFCQK